LAYKPGIFRGLVNICSVKGIEALNELEGYENFWVVCDGDYF
jgi:hypothetical protein